MTAIAKDQISVTFDGYLRYGEISDRPTGEKTSGFKSGDRNLVVQRTDLRDCLPLIADDEIKAKIVSGAATQ